MAVETATNAPITPAPTLPAAAPAVTTAAPRAAPLAAKPPVQTTPALTPAAAPAAAAPSAARVAAVQAIAKPQTDDAADDEYSYGFRLWSAGFFPEARQQLTQYVEQYPNHARISYGRNLLGRAFLDDKMPDEAARWFLKNYQANKNGERAPDSLLYLGASMIAMKDTKRACIALAEFAETYPLIAAGRLASEYQANRAKVKCS
jgi:TolA-binding protein